MLQIRHGIFIAVIAIGVGRFLFSTGAASGAPRTSTHAPAAKAAASQHERRQRAWRAWYNRYHRVLRPGYYYPPGYPPGYTPGSTPTTGPSGGENNGVAGAAPGGGNNGALFHNKAVDAPAPAADAAPSTPQQVDPDVLAAVAHVKAACMARPDYQAALADKKAAEDRLVALRPDGQEIDPAIAMPLANAALEASQRISVIELEETTKDAQKAGLPPQTQPGEAASK